MPALATAASRGAPPTLPPGALRILGPGDWFGKPHAEETTWCAISNGSRIIALVENRELAEWIIQRARPLAHIA